MNYVQQRESIIMVRDVLWSAAVCTSKGLLYACRFLWVSPYHALSEVPRRHCDAGSAHSSQTENAKESESQERPHCHGRSNVVHKRLCKVEGEIELLRAQICSEKASWELRFVELQRKQQELRDQLSSEPFLGEDGEDVGPAEPKAENAHSFVDKDLPSSSKMSLHHQPETTEVMSLRCTDSQGSLTSSQVSLSSSFVSRSTSAMSINSSAGSSRSSALARRVFVPHSHLDLQIGHRVRVLLPSGSISTGTLRYLGPLGGGREIHLGVELEKNEPGQRDGSHGGQCYFRCQPGRGTFVAFNKLLMAWE